MSSSVVEVNEPDQISELRENIKEVKRKNEEFNKKFTDVSFMIKNYIDGKMVIKNQELEYFLNRVIDGRPKENYINLTMTVLDLIYINLSNEKNMYYFPKGEYLTNYDKLKEIEKRYSVLRDSINR